MPHRTLPTEIIVLVVESLAPCSPRTILTPRHATTKTLLSFTTVCQATYLPALRLLRKHCAYIDSKSRALAFQQCLSNSPPPFLAGNPQAGRGLSDLESLFLAPFPPDDRVFPIPVDDGISVVQPAPLNDLGTATHVQTILLAVAPTLKRMVIDMPLRSLYPENDYDGVRPVLRQAFEALVNMEEFVSIRDELYLDTIDSPSPMAEPEVWATCWPRLRRLSLYNTVVEPELGCWKQMAHLPDFEMAVFCRTDPADTLNSLDVKRTWFEAVAESRGTSLEHVRRDPRPLTFLHVNIASEQADPSALVSSWRGLDPENHVRVLLIDVPTPSDDNRYSNDPMDWPLQPRDICQDWLLERAFAGTLWDEASNAYDPCSD